MNEENKYPSQYHDIIFRIIHQGENLGTRIFAYNAIQLYLYNNRYFEIWYHQTTKKIDRLIELEAEEIIDLYEINIPNF